MSEIVEGSNGLLWHFGGQGTDDHLALGGHETPVIGIAKALLHDGGCFLDVGAHVGLWSLTIAKDKRARCYAIEANSKTFDRLRANVVLNQARLNGGQVYVERYAAWDVSGVTLDLEDPNGMETGGSTRCVPHPLRQPLTGPRTIGVRLDDDSELPQVDLVKIDVEGAEGNVLRGMTQILDRDRPRLIIEMHDMYYGPQIRDEVFSVLEQHRYVWNEDVVFGGSYYLIAQPAESVGDNPQENA